MSQKTGKKYAAAAAQVEARPLRARRSHHPRPEDQVREVRRDCRGAHAPWCRSEARRPDGPRHHRAAERSWQVEESAGDRGGPDKIREALENGADIVGGEEIVTRIKTEGWIDYDAVIATPDMMRSVGRLGKVLGPRGLMPNPKTGTVTRRCRQSHSGNQGR